MDPRPGRRLKPQRLQDEPRVKTWKQPREGRGTRPGSLRESVAGADPPRRTAPRLCPPGRRWRAQAARRVPRPHSETHTHCSKGLALRFQKVPVCGDTALVKFGVQASQPRGRGRVRSTGSWSPCLFAL